MKKTLMAAGVATVLAGMAGAAAAQSNVNIYGLVDTGYVKESGTDARQGHNYESRIGFMGSEDLGNGIKATFQLEKRFNLNDGTNSTAANTDDLIASAYGGGRGAGNYGNAPDWTGAANVGLASNTWGAIRFGRVNNLAVESYLRIDPFGYYSVGAATAASNGLYAEQLSNTARYDSPVWQGASFGLSYTLGADEDSVTEYSRYTPAGIERRPYMKDKGNDGFNILLQYDNGPLLLMANYQRVADSDNSYLWNVGVAYKFGPARVSLGYQDSRDKISEGMSYGAGNIRLSEVKQRDWILGLNWEVGPGEIKASVNYGKVDGTAGGAQGVAHRVDDDVLKYSLGYTYNLSKRTSVYGVVTYIDSDNEYIGSRYNTNGTYRESMTGVQLGMTHRF